MNGASTVSADHDFSSMDWSQAMTFSWRQYTKICKECINSIPFYQEGLSWHLQRQSIS